jgi:hypothetical protein
VAPFLRGATGSSFSNERASEARASDQTRAIVCVHTTTQARFLVYRDVNADSATLQRTLCWPAPHSRRTSPRQKPRRTYPLRDQTQHHTLTKRVLGAGRTGVPTPPLKERESLTPVCPRALDTCADLDAESKSTLFPMNLRLGALVTEPKRAALREFDRRSASPAALSRAPRECRHLFALFLRRFLVVPGGFFVSHSCDES